MASADMIAEVAKIKFEKNVDEEGEMDMCKGMQEYTLKTKVLGAIECLKNLNTSENDIISQIVKIFNVSEEYVKSLIEAKPA